MRPLTAPELLRVWDEGRTRSPGERALLPLAVACPDEPWEALAALPIGRRDHRLLTLREWAFGPDLEGMARCPACGERLELRFSVADLRAGSDPALPDELDLDAAGYAVRFRLPNSMDLAALQNADPTAARATLLERCLLGARRNGRSRSVRRLPARVLTAVVRRMGEVDPQADVHTSLTCPACTHTWEAPFDIAAFFWSEIEAWAHRTLREVHVLARAYAWREGDILALSPGRRRLYLELVNG